MLTYSYMLIMRLFSKPFFTLPLPLVGLKSLGLNFAHFFSLSFLAGFSQQEKAGYSVLCFSALSSITRNGCTSLSVVSSHSHQPDPLSFLILPSGLAPRLH